MATAPVQAPPHSWRIPAVADSIPLLSPLIAPNLRALGPILSQLATSPLRSGVEQWLDLLKGAAARLAVDMLLQTVRGALMLAGCLGGHMLWWGPLDL